jgi:hypothetical protein
MVGGVFHQIFPLIGNTARFSGSFVVVTEPRIQRRYFV